MQKNKFIIYCGLFEILTGLLLGGCGKAGENISPPLTEPEANSTAPDVIYTEPPIMELQSVSDETELVFLRSGGYNWTYLESEDAATSSIADSAYILAENSSWETLILPEDDSEMSAYTISVAKLPDELGFTAWDIADVGKNSGEVNPLVTCRYSMAEIGAPDFSISLQSGRIYEIYMEWNEDKLAENGFSGIAYYAVKTARGEPVENGLTEKANDILISIDDSYSLTVHNAETGEDVKSGTDTFLSQFSDILTKYINLDIEKDEYQYTDDSVTYRMEIFDSDGQLVQTIEYLGEYLYIDKVRYRETGAGTTEELYLAIDSLFAEDFPTASFGETDTEEVDVIEEVAMEAAYASPKGIHLVFTNHTNEEYMFGDDYELQAWQDGEWRKVDYIIDNAAFHAIGYSLAGNSSVGWSVKWTYFHGLLPDGVYRITKTINKGTGKEMDKYRLAAEFTITNISSSYTGVKIGTTNIWDEKRQEITVQLSNGESYEITKETFVIDHDQFLPEYSVVDYPVIKFSDEAINDRLGEKINRIFYETAMLNYDEELGQEINAEYACYYRIANADEEYISIFYESTIGAGGGHTNSCFGVTVSLADGNEMSLADFMDIDEIGHRLSDYSGTFYVDWEGYIDLWLENKEELIEEWLEDERSPLHGWYLYEGRIGFFFMFNQNNQEHFFMEFSGIIDIF